jgi:hypothetical protein
MKRFWPVLMLALMVALLLPLAAAGPAYAAGCGNDHAVIGDAYTLAAGQQLDGNLIVLGGQATVAPGATVNCKVIVMGGTLDLAGKVGQDVVVMGGQAHLRGTAEVDGQLQSLGGGLTQDAGARIIGGVSQGFSSGSGAPVPPPALGNFSIFDAVFSLYRGIARAILGALGFGLIALLVVLVFPEQAARVSGTLSTAPVASGALGLLTGIALPVLMAVATLTICLIPVAAVAAVLLAAALALGWIALGALLGYRLVAGLRLVNLSPAVAAALGTALLSLLVSAVNQVPCVGWVVPVILGSAGLGAVTLTRFGTQPYFPGRPVPPAVPPIQPALNS